MNEVHRLRAILHEGLALASRGDFNGALARITTALADARTLGDRELTSLLARNAAIVCEDAGDFAKAEQHYAAAIDETDRDPFLFIALARVSTRLGRGATAHLERAFEIASASGNQKALDLLRTLGWPPPA